MEENQELQAQEKIINVDIEREMKKSFLAKMYNFFMKTPRFL